MMWIVLILVIVLLIAGVITFWIDRKNKQSEETRERGKWSIGMGLGGAFGAVIGILLVEYGGYSYPLPVILWMMGMAAGQVVGIVYSRYRR
ncbi:MAG: hypothetical protein HXS45_08565 [Theionarchaea archaeon]|nr:hypothetical protein [Theionarchaea archaeon]